MTKTKTVKRALILSCISMLLCVSMLVGSTFAWFTDSAATGVGSVVAGTLDIDLVDAAGNSLEGKTIGFADKDDNDLWEPGCRYTLDTVKLVNWGDLNAKYKVVITATTGDADLAEVIDVYEGETKLGTLRSFLDKADGIKEGVIAPGATLEFGTLTLVMQTTAGNEYQGKSITDISITVLATQAAVESDSFDNQYDKDAEYLTGVVIYDSVSISAGQTLVVRGGEVSSYKLIEASGDSVVINDVTYRGTAIVWGAGGMVTINGGTYTATAVAVNDSGTAPVIINGGTFNVSSIDASSGATVTINGGTFTCNPTNFIASGKTVIDNGNGTWTVQ